MKKKPKYYDDGHTIYNMDVEGMPHRRPKNSNGEYITREEKFAVIKAGLRHYMPIVFGVIFCFLAAMLLIYFWLH